MPRNLGAVDNNLLNALAAQETNEAILVLLTITHASLSPPIRVTSNSVQTESNGNTFYQYPFNLTLPNDPESGFSSGRLTIDNVGREIISSIRSISTPLTIMLQVVMASAPNTVYVEFSDFKLTNIKYDALTITADLVLDHFINEPFPGNRITPSNFPGMF